MARKRFKVDARAILSLGRDSIKDHVTAVVELVKNSYDAGARIAEITIFSAAEKAQERYITIADNGCGLDAKGIEDRWLRIGFSEKLKNKQIGSRRRLGEKGVGRLSADRLGAKLNFKSQAKGKPSVLLEIDWSKFEKSGADIGSVLLEVSKPTDFKVPQPSLWNESDERFEVASESLSASPTVTGSELRITLLRQNWSDDDVERLRNELQQLINPFDEGVDFQVRLISDVAPKLNGVVKPDNLIEGEIEGDFTIDGDMVKISHISRIARKANGKPVKKEIELKQFLDLSEGEISEVEKLGPVRVRLLLYTIGETLSDHGKKAQISTFLKRNAGVRVYRDGVRVLPYGDLEKAEGDWLGLAALKAKNRAGVSRKDWRIESNRIVGAVKIERDSNAALQDAAGREGLIENDAFRLLRLFALYCIRDLEIAYQAARTPSPADPTDILNPRKIVREVKGHLDDLGKDLAEAAKKLPKDQGEELLKIRAKIESKQKQSQKLSQSLNEMMDEALIQRGLATLGIAHASFGHEIQMSAGQFIDAAYAASLELNSPPNLDNARRELEKAIKHGKRISNWGSYTLTRVKATKRKPQPMNIRESIPRLVGDLVPLFQGSKIDLKVGEIEDITTSIALMEIESIVINLLTNAYDFVKESPRLPRTVCLSILNKESQSKQGIEILVSDSGPGVSSHIRSDIWKPLFTTKRGPDKQPSGTGLGLSIVTSIIRDLNGHCSVEDDAELGGALFRVWMPNYNEVAQ